MCNTMRMCGWVEGTGHAVRISISRVPAGVCAAFARRGIVSHTTDIS